jgi:hypothetical protein
MLLSASRSLAALAAAATAFVALPSAATTWRTYYTFPGGGRAQDLDADSVTRAGQRVYFTYREHWRDLPSADRTIQAVVDCDRRQRSDLGAGGATVMRDVFPDTGQDRQLVLACQLGGVPLRAAGTVVPAAPTGGAVFAREADAPPVPAPHGPYSVADAQLLWEEALDSFNGLSYDYTVYGFASKEEAQSCIADSRCLLDAHLGWSRREERSNELPLGLRQAVISTPLDTMSQPVQAAASGRWNVVKVTGLHNSSFQTAVTPMQWLADYAAKALPDPEQLRGDPILRMRHAMGQVVSPEDLRQALDDGRIDVAHLDMPLANGSTLLERAIVRRRQDLLEAVAAAGASIEAPGWNVGPLSMAVYAHNRVAERWLLDHGARVDAETAGVSALMAASSMGDREGAEMLLGAGADPLRTHEDHVLSFTLKRSMLYYAPSSQPEYVEWLAGVMNGRLEKSGHYAWRAWIEQNGTRQPIVDGATINLRRQPFRIVMRAPEGVSLQLACSEEDGFGEKAHSAVYRRALLAPARAAAIGADSDYLAPGKVTVPASGIPSYDGAHIELSRATDPNLDTGTRRVEEGKGGAVDVHAIGKITLATGTVAIAQYPGHAVHAIMGTVPPLGVATDFFEPARFTLNFH